jgi:hypothetical protein
MADFSNKRIRIQKVPPFILYIFFLDTTKNADTVLVITAAGCCMLYYIAMTSAIVSFSLRHNIKFIVINAYTLREPLTKHNSRPLFFFFFFILHIKTDSKLVPVFLNELLQNQINLLFLFVS